MTELFRSQRKIHDAAIERLFVRGQRGIAILARIGSGKTKAVLETLNTLKNLGEIKRALIVAPLRILDFTWPNELKKWGYDLSYTRVNGGPLSNTSSDLVFCTPDSLHKISDAAMAGKFDLILIDEVTKFKVWTTKRMKLLRKILPFIPRRIVMTGTLVANALQDMHGPMFIVDDGDAIGKNVTVFRNRYMIKGGWKGRGWAMRETASAELLPLISSLSVILQPDDYNDLPELVVNDLLVALPPVAQSHHTTMKRELFLALSAGERLTAGSAAAAYSKCRQITAGFVYRPDKLAEEIHQAKIEALSSILDESGGRPILVFYQFKANAARIEAALGRCSIIAGGQTDSIARKQINDWLSGKNQILLAQVTAAGMGLNLQTGGCDTMVFFELPESGETMRQTIGRLQREGGAKRIFMHRILAKNTIDEVVKERAEGKLKTEEEFEKGLYEWAGKN